MPFKTVSCANIHYFLLSCHRITVFLHLFLIFFPHIEKLFNIFAIFAGESPAFCVVAPAGLHIQKQHVKNIFLFNTSKNP